ncbi:MAG TPA: ATP-binding protein, partial [bacterium]|nr:ATP-binding protein [bacterium]
ISKICWFWLGIFFSLTSITNWYQIIYIDYQEIYQFKIYVILLFLCYLSIIHFIFKNYPKKINKKIIYICFILAIVLFFIKPTQIENIIKIIFGLLVFILLIHFYNHFIKLEFEKNLYLRIFIVVLTIDIFINALLSKSFLSNFFKSDLLFVIIKYFDISIVFIIFYCLNKYFYQEINKIEEGKAIRQIFKNLGFLILALLIITFFLLNYSEKKSFEIIKNQIKLKSNYINKYLSNELKRANGGAISLSGSLPIKELLEKNNNKNLERANEVIDRYKNSFDFSICYIFDTGGTVVASTNRNDTDSFIGKNYKFRQYFQKAIAGELSKYFALGVTSKTKGYYVCAPVRNNENKIIGAVTVKNNLSDIINIFKLEKNIFLINNEGIIFLSGIPELENRALFPITKEELEKVEKEKQFGDAKIISEPVFPKKIKKGEKIWFKNQEYLFCSQNINYENWNLIYLHSLQLLKFSRFSVIVLITLLMLFILIIGFAYELKWSYSWIQKITETEKKFKEIFENSPLPIFIYEKTTNKIISANKYMLNKSGWTFEELNNIELNQIIKEDEKELVKLITKEKKELIIEIFKTEFANYIIYILNDITEKKINEEKILKLNKELAKAIEELKSLDELKNQFLANISHELNTPIVLIKGYIELLLTQKLGKLNEEQINQLSIALRNTNRLCDLIEELLEFSKYESGKIELKDINDFDIIEVCEESLKELNIKFEEKKIKVNKEYSDKKIIIKGVPKKIKQVFINLIDNAIKFSNNNSEINVLIIKKENFVEVSITDYGIGIPEDKYEKIFDKFYQIDGTRTKKIKGAGIGLFICKEIIKLHKGEIFVQSKIGYGSTFVFRLPLSV